MRRRDLIRLGGAIAAGWPLAARAQQGKIAKIGVLYPGSTPLMALRAGYMAESLRQVGYVEGRDFAFVLRPAEFAPERLAAFAVELAGRKLSAIVAVARAAEEAALAATKTIPIIAIDLETDPIASGYVSGYARPGGNFTGVFSDFPELSAKWLQLLGETLPGLQRVAVLSDPSVGPIQLTAISAAAAPLGVTLQVLEVRVVADLATAFDTAVSSQAQAVIVLSSPLAGGNSERLATLAAAHRIPALSLFTEFAHAGGLMAYGPKIEDLFRQIGGLVGKVLAGRSPAELPVERPTRVRLVINAKAAAALGVVFPPVLLARADEVIE